MFFAKFRHKRFNAKTAYGKPSPSRDCRLRIPGWGEVAGSVSGSFEEEDWERLQQQQGGGGPRVPAAAHPVIEPPGAPTGARWPAIHPLPCVETPPAHTAPAKCSEVAKKKLKLSFIYQRTTTQSLMRYSTVYSRVTEPAWFSYNNCTAL